MIDMNPPKLRILEHIEVFDPYLVNLQILCMGLHKFTIFQEPMSESDKGLKLLTELRIEEMVLGHDWPSC